MKCTNCGTENFDVAVKCARCHAVLSNINPVYRSTPDPEPPTQISGSGFEKIRFGPAPDSLKKNRPQKIQRPSTQKNQHLKIQESDKRPPISQNQRVEKNQNNSQEPSVILFGAFALSLGVSFLMLCIDFYSFFL
ncbi:MAG: hypothetical protein CL916_13355, partial [Deltaproteobacteria bacterium]|nr:hypothetical protein [Deltaproteobacteria bacterium]